MSAIDREEREARRGNLLFNRTPPCSILLRQSFQSYIIHFIRTTNVKNTIVF